MAKVMINIIEHLWIKYIMLIRLCFFLNRQWSNWSIFAFPSFRYRVSKASKIINYQIIFYWGEYQSKISVVNFKQSFVQWYNCSKKKRVDLCGLSIKSSDLLLTGRSSLWYYFAFSCFLVVKWAQTIWKHRLGQKR